MIFIVIVHKNNRFRTRIPNNTLSRLKSAHCFSRKILLLFHKINRSNTKNKCLHEKEFYL